jgi:cytochrome c6
MYAFFLLIAFFAITSAFGPAGMRTRSSLQMINGKQVFAGVAAAAIALAPGAVFAKDIENGAQVFAGNCAACHAGGNNVIQNEKTLRKEALDQYLAGGLKETSIVTQVTNGKNAMPAFGGRLDAEEIEDVAAYVYDQATNAKWD